MATSPDLLHWDQSTGTVYSPRQNRRPLSWNSTRERPLPCCPCGLAHGFWLPALVVTLHAALFAAPFGSSIYASYCPDRLMLGLLQRAISTTAGRRSWGRCSPTTTSPRRASSSRSAASIGSRTLRSRCATPASRRQVGRTIVAGIWVAFFERVPAIIVRTGATGLASSTDGINWQRASAVSPNTQPRPSLLLEAANSSSACTAACAVGAAAGHLPRARRPALGADPDLRAEPRRP